MGQIKLRYLSFMVIVMTWSVAAVGFTQAESIEPQMVNVPSVTCTWNGLNGNWNDPTKWNSCAGGVPGAADTAVVASGTLTLTSNVTLGTLNFTGGTIQGNASLVVTNMTWTGGTWKDSGTTTVNGTLDLSNSSVTLTQRTFTNAGTATLGGSSVYLIMTNGAVFNNQSSLQFSHTSTGQITYSTGGGTFNNSGYITKTFASSGFTYIYVPFNNSGSVTANNGIFYLAPAVATTSNNSGSFNIASAALWQMAGSGTVNFNAASGLVGAGTVNFTSGTTTFKVGSTYAISNTQVIGGVADLSATSAVTFGNVTTVGSSTLILGNATMLGNLTRLGGTFTAASGTLTFNGGTTQSLSLNVPTTFNNLAVASGTTLSETVTANNATVAGTLSNQGIIRKTETLSASGVYTFGLTGAVISITVPGSLSSTTVDWVGQPHPAATYGIATNHYWNITPSGSGYTAALILPYTFPVPQQVSVCHFNSGTLVWDCGRSAYTANTVTWSGLTALSGDWAIGQGYYIVLPWVQR